MEGKGENERERGLGKIRRREVCRDKGRKEGKKGRSNGPKGR